MKANIIKAATSNTSTCCTEDGVPSAAPDALAQKRAAFSCQTSRKAGWSGWSVALLPYMPSAPQPGAPAVKNIDGEKRHRRKLSCRLYSGQLSCVISIKGATGIEEGDHAMPASDQLRLRYTDERLAFCGLPFQYAVRVSKKEALKSDTHCWYTILLVSISNCGGGTKRILPSGDIMRKIPMPAQIYNIAAARLSLGYQGVASCWAPSEPY